MGIYVLPKVPLEKKHPVNMATVGLLTARVSGAVETRPKIISDGHIPICSREVARDLAVLPDMRGSFVMVT